MSVKELAIQRLTQQIAPVLKAQGIVRAGLFGSVARGEAKRGSDVDILIETDGTLGLFEFVGLKQALESRLKRHVDLVEYSTIKPALRKKIMLDHIQLV